ncbi:MAG: tRNA (5-methylaminomethyl-2-thiouridine)(34)-methyltransferase MnmD [Bacteroidales bacterium]|nr:tRNA (5-methylaminomethyl-2-thiouridine)(34)-methyltransferase MnmD [Bacteroidales bacterium]
MNASDLVISGDGSHTLKLKGVDEHYHSVYGALAESRHVFIRAGLKHISLQGNEELSILELGFGTGLNTLLTLCELLDKGVETLYTAIEAFPLEDGIWQRLNYPELIRHKQARELFLTIHEAAWEKTVKVEKGFLLHKRQIKFQDLQPGPEQYNLVYFDAFSPEVQPELWTEDIFRKIAQMLVKEGILVTYSAKGSVRRALETSGLRVERLPGPEGKREMIRAIKC